MHQGPTVDSLLAAAQAAAETGDLLRAERLLRDVVTTQESSLGSAHPDLASTLNNLAIVCERAGKMTDAEQCYRRAYGVAVAALPENDPAVVTSRANLEDFCRARQMPFEVAPARSAPAAGNGHGSAGGGRSPRADAIAQFSPEGRPGLAARIPREPATPVNHQASGPTGFGLFWHRRGAVAIAGVAAALFFLVGRAWLTSRSASSAVAQIVEETAIEPAPVVTPPPAVASPPPSLAAPAVTRRTDATQGLRLVEARLCQTLATGAGAWDCQTPQDPAEQGVLAFYTRIASPREVRVEHRWFHEGRLQQVVPLRLGANPDMGYRTFSRRRVSGAPGAWRVELRSEDGALVAEERFVVR